MPSSDLAVHPVRGVRAFRRRGRVPGILAAVLATVAAGCSTATPAGVYVANNPVPDRVAFLNIIPIESLTYTPEMIAEAAGLFDREGLDVEFQYTRGSAQGIQDVLGGAGLLSRVGDAEMMTAIGVRNAEIVAVAQPSQRSTLRVVSLPDNPVRTPADMRGRVIGVPTAGGTSEALVDLLATAGGIPESDFTKRVVGLGPGLLDFVRQGQVDAYVDSMDNAIALRLQDPDVVVLDPAEFTVTGTQMYVASTRAVDDPDRRDQIRRYLRAIRAAMQMVIDDPSLDQTLGILAQRWDIPILRQPEVAKQTLRDYIASWMANGALMETPPERWAGIYEETSQVGLVPAGLDPAPWFTNDLLVDQP